MGTLPALPWRLRHFATSAVNALHYGHAQARRARGAPHRQGLRIHFEIPEYGITGGALALIHTANLLCAEHTVSFQRTLASDRNRFLKPSVGVNPGDAASLDCCIIESGIPPSRLAEFKRLQVPILVSNHGYPARQAGAMKGYGYTDQTIQSAFAVADGLQFVNAAQRDEFFKLGWIRSPDYIVQNCVDAVSRPSTPTHNCGIVCDTRLPLKNAAAAIQAGLASNAQSVQVWGRYDRPHPDSRVRMNGFGKDKARIFGSFDVLVLLSYTEVQPLCVLEAISCGIPCVLSDIPCYGEFRGLPGFLFTPPDDIAAATRAINTALSHREQWRDGLILLWKLRYAPDAVTAVWETTLRRLLANPRQADRVDANDNGPVACDACDTGR